MRNLTLLFGLAFLVLASCESNEFIQVEGNQAPNYKGVSMLKIENYINRLYIDLMGREPTDSERLFASKRLKDNNLSIDARDSLVFEIQNDTNYRVGDSSYRHAYIQRMYDLMKYRFIEGAADPEVSQKLGNIKFAKEIARLNGDSVRVKQMEFEAKKYENILNWKYAYRNNADGYPELCGYLMNNGIYDVINMGTFNFINAAFDDVLGRWPNKEEFDAAYAIVEKNEPKVVFNQVAQNKQEFINALVESDAFFESQIRWWYFQYLRNEIEPAFLYKLLLVYNTSNDIEEVQRKILIRDDYAQF